MGWSKDPGPPTWRGDPAPLFFGEAAYIMADRILSCFIDEAGDFGEYEPHSPYYIVSLVTHDQSESIQSEISSLDSYLSSLGFSNHALHTGPLIRRESTYIGMNMEDRKKLFNLLFRFTRKIPIKFFTALVKKLECSNSDICFNFCYIIPNNLKRHMITFPKTL